MLIQLIACLIAIIAFFVYQAQVSDRRLMPGSAKDSYIYFICLILILQSGLRNVAVGPDTYEYYLQFERIQSTSWQQVFDYFITTYETGVGKDPGYGIFMKLVSTLISNYQIYLMLIATIFFCSFSLMLKRFCSDIYDVFVAMLVYQALFYGFFSITGIRQTLAISILFYAFPLVYKRKLLIFLFICLIASTIHKSSLLFIPFYFIAKIKSPVKLLTYVLIALPIVFVMMRPIALYMTSFSFTESYAVYSESVEDAKGAQMFFIFMLAISILILLCRKSIADQPEIFKMGLNAFALGLFFTPLTWVDPNLMRVVMYFSVYSIFITGDLIRIYSYRKKLFLFSISVLLTVAVVFSIIKRNYDYAFFWQNMELPDNYY